ncbi:MAG: methylmalonyl Co-A mutase-associated GTPase MeaB, partial [Chitinophagaceae bacterium]|nr:methylmalonyl Co-A mutase-associated GTPase MeaB [Chitinophagaceae bacterium]
MWNSLPEKIRQGDSRALSRAISLVENEVAGYENFLQELPYNSAVKITGITGPPGAGKSTLVDGLIGEYTGKGERVSVICVDPSSAFTGGAVLGDRVRMRQWYNHPDVFIRSLSTRGTLGGLNSGIVEITDIIRT